MSGAGRCHQNTQSSSGNIADTSYTACRLLPPPATGTVASVASLTPTFSPGPLSLLVKCQDCTLNFSFLTYLREPRAIDQRGNFILASPKQKTKRCKSPGTRIFSSRVKMASTWTPTGNTKEDQRRRDQVSNLYPSYPLYCSKNYFL